MMLSDRIEFFSSLIPQAAHFKYDLLTYLSYPL
jgi:hypothetical protein